MKTRRLLGLAALGGGIYWMQKKRGGDMSFASIKESFRGLADDLMNKANLKRADEPSAATSATTGASRPVAGSTGATYGGTTGTYTGSASGGSGYSGSGNFGGRGGFGGNGGTRH